VRKLLVSVLIALLLVGTVLAIHDFQVYDNNIDSYAGQIARDRRIYDPYTRSRYFGEDYYRPYNNFGMKGPTDRLLNTGAKSAYSSVFNLDSNTLSNRGRDPAYISNWDPKIRGYPRLDRSVTLLPYTYDDLSLAGEPFLAEGTARVFSIGDVWGSGFSKPFPKTQVFVALQNIEPMDENEILEAWLYDEETGYALTVGLMKPAAKLTAELFFEFPRLVYMFEDVIITREAFPDYDPRPGQIVLAGSIDPARTQLNIDPSIYERVR